jgi:non-canonical (house-cleaning) NTP pyrophosphatase
MRKKVTIPMNYNDIVARIKKGEDPEAIVKEFTDNINKAQKEVAAEAAKANEAKSKKMDEISMAIAHALNEYAVVAGIPDVKLRGAEVRSILDEFLPVIESLKDVKIHVAKANPKKTKSIDDVFTDFFKSMGI